MSDRGRPRGSGKGPSATAGASPPGTSGSAAKAAHGRWTIYVCPECGEQAGDEGPACEHEEAYLRFLTEEWLPHRGPIPPEKDWQAIQVAAVPAHLLEQAREALRAFVNMAARWEEQNEQSWDDSPPEIFPTGEWGPEWFAEMEVCNRDVLRAREVLARLDALASGAGDGGQQP